MSVGVVLLLVAGLVLLIGGAELLVRGGSALAGALGVSPLVIGLTVVAFGTSAPELATSVMAAAGGQPGIAVGNVIGSNNFNILVILGLSAVIAPLAVARQLLRFDVPLMVGVSAAAWAMAADGVLSRWEGALLGLGIIVYTVLSVRASRKATAALQEEFRDELRLPSRVRRTAGHLLLVALGLALLVLGSRWLVAGAEALARAFGVSELVIGLTIVAGGTSLPELATSAIAALRRHIDIAVGNVVGSNLFNLTSVLGASAVVANRGLEVSDQARAFDLPVMVVVAAACLPVFLSGRTVARWEGTLFLVAYVGYIGWLMAVVRSGVLPSPLLVVAAFALPLIVVTSLPLLRRRVR